jgi:hypothetical protein
MLPLPLLKKKAQEGTRGATPCPNTPPLLPPAEAVAKKSILKKSESSRSGGVAERRGRVSKGDDRDVEAPLLPRLEPSLPLRTDDSNFFYREEDAGYASGIAAVAEESETRARPPNHRQSEGSEMASSSMPNVRDRAASPPAASAAAATIRPTGKVAAGASTTSIFSPCSATPPSLLDSYEHLGAFSSAATATALIDRGNGSVVRDLISSDDSATNSRDIQTSTTTLAAAAAAAAAARRKFERGRDPSHHHPRSDNSSNPASTNVAATGTGEGKSLSGEILFPRYSEPDSVIEPFSDSVPSPPPPGDISEKEEEHARLLPRASAGSEETFP